MPKTEGAPSQVVRAVRLLRRLQGRRRGLRLDELAAEHAVSRSQIRRDLLALEDAGVGLVFDREPGRYGRARVRLTDADSTRLALTRRERWTLLAVRRVFDVFAGTALHEDVTSVLEKVADTLPVRERTDLRALAERVVYLPSGGIKRYSEDTADVIDALQDGVMLQRRVRYVYRPRFRPASAGEMEPYAFVLFRNGLYVAASRRFADGTRQPPRVFAVERFREAEPVRQSRFQRPPDLDLESLFDGAFGIISGNRTHHVVVDLGRAAAVEAHRRRWHPTQTLTPLPRGRARVQFDVSSLQEVVPWILEWGPQAEAIEPPELRRRVARALRRAAARYPGV